LSEKRVLEKENEGSGRFWWHQTGEAKCNQPQPKPGDTCSNCHEGRLTFDGLFILMCDRCQHIADSGGFT